LITNPEFFDKLISFRSNGVNNFHPVSSNKKMKFSEKKENKKKSLSSINSSAKAYKSSLVSNVSIVSSNKKDKKEKEQSSHKEEKNSFSSNKKFLVNIEYPSEGIVNNLNESLNKISIDKENVDEGEKSEKKNNCHNDSAILNQIDEIINNNVVSIPEERNEDEGEVPVVINFQKNLNLNLKIESNEKSYIRKEKIEKPKINLKEIRREIAKSYNLEIDTIQFNIQPDCILKKNHQSNSYQRSESFCIINQDKEKKRLSFINNFSKNNTCIEVREDEGKGDLSSGEKKIKKGEDYKCKEEESQSEETEKINFQEKKVKNTKRAKSANDKKNKAKSKSKSRNKKKK
jgi:hypothetical protein